jgi:hypothetical protein
LRNAATRRLRSSARVANDVRRLDPFQRDVRDVVEGDVLLPGQPVVQQRGAHVVHVMCWACTSSSTTTQKLMDWPRLIETG